MQMFNWNPGPGQPIASPYLYVFFAVTIPVTIMIYAAWFWWDRYSQRKYRKKRVDGGLGDVEKELRMRVRTATESW